MAKRKKTALSEGFGKARLDDIGAWKQKVNHNGHLWIEWKSPEALADLSLPRGLLFTIDNESGSCDPDEEMFRLWDLFLSRKSEFEEQLRNLTSQHGPIEFAKLVVERWGTSYRLNVWMAFEEDDEHTYHSYYEEREQAFGPLVC